MTSRKAPPPVRKRLRISDALVLGGVAALLLAAAANVFINMKAAGIEPGFGFLLQEAGFNVSESLIPYSPGDSYAHVILTGLVNTAFLAVICLVFATLIGTAFGLVSVGPSPIGRALALGYVEVFRNIPKLLVLLILFVVAVNGLPHVRSAFSLGPVHLSNRSINFPLPIWNDRSWILCAAILAGAVAAFHWEKWRERRRLETGHAVPLNPLLVLLLIPIAAVYLFDVPVEFSLPELKGFDYQGGGRVSLQFGVIATTLSIYHGAQIAEVVRGGIQAIPKGQNEAALALGISPWQRIRLVILPQVMRIVVPPMNNQYVNLIKNTSIAIAVGYSDLMSVSGTIINQSFKPLEMMLISMALYLAMCLSLTTWLNHAHRRMIVREAR